MSFPIDLKSSQVLISELAYLYISAGNKKAAGWSSLRQQYLSFPEFHKGIHNWYSVVGGENSIQRPGPIM